MLKKYKIKVFDGYCDQADTVIKDLDREISNDYVLEIAFHGEGLSLRDTDLGQKNIIEVLKEICQRKNVNETNVKLVSGNPVEDKTVWPNIELYYDDSHFLYGQTLKTTNTKNWNNINHFAFFVGASRWERLWISCVLYNEHKEKTLLSFHKNARLHNVDKEKMFRLCASNNLVNYFENFSKATPIVLQTRPEDHYFAHSDAYTLNEFYNRFFLEIVTESFHSGTTFCPSEKTARPISNETPFILFGPKHFLKHLNKIGFKTFSPWWNEQYDECSGYERLKEIHKVINHISGKNIKELEKMYEEMKPVLAHNLKLYKSLKHLDMEYKLLI